ncbi:hypothetical protein GE253_14060 [Niveispirillum sp. SYP-B3756]|uniref:hypothetical protein n=1 Tax=Niveispirillum sp. SYP-B3756 TaxID=2662178 RepID=UPI001290A7ED|nr:hypothetical protein [Niveispirillum sp. SYP-B3756]MQP66455.1 hypothetical protein [Niveispirillum sp. SYP-B3756]
MMSAVVVDHSLAGLGVKPMYRINLAGIRHPFIDLKARIEAGERLADIAGMSDLIRRTGAA